MSEEQVFIKLRKKHIKVIEDKAARVIQNFIKMLIKRNWWRKLVSKLNVLYNLILEIKTIEQCNKNIKELQRLQKMENSTKVIEKTKDKCNNNMLEIYEGLQIQETNKQSSLNYENRKSTLLFLRALINIKKRCCVNYMLALSKIPCQEIR